MKSYTGEEYIAAGCKEMHGAMLAIHVITAGRICDTGCWAFDGGKCPAYRKLISFKGQSKAEILETVRQEAARRGISISQVRRERQGESK